MASVTKRKQLVNELRKAHFPFGFDQNNQKSQYTAKYPEYKTTGPQEPNDNARKNNFSIGNQNDIDNAAYRSQFKDKFPNYNVKGKQEAIGAKNLGTNNIVFGYDQDNAFKTNYKDEFDKKNSQNNRVKPSDLKKNNIDFGDSLTDFTTTYGKVFDKKGTPLQQNNGNAHKIDKTEVRKSHLMLGNDQSTFETQNGAVYRNNFAASSNHVHKESNSSNINLGTDGVSYASECKQRFTVNGGAQKQVVGKQVIRDFRSAHFHFGFPEQKQNFQSQAKNQFNSKPIDVVFVDGRKPSNVHLNVDGNNYFQSSYGQQYANWGTQPRQQINKHGRNDNILIGTDVNPAQRYVSQAKDNFGTKPIARVQPIKLQGTLQLGEQVPDFRTQNQMTYDDKFGRRQNNKLSQEEINKMKAINIVTGFQGNNYSLHSNEYGKKQGERGQLSKETLSKMKNTNIVLETVPNVANLEATSYKAAYPYKINHEY